MLAIHSVAKLEAKTSLSTESNWISLTLTEPDGETKVELTIYFATRRRGFNEEHRYAAQLAAAINSIKQMDVGNWGSQEEPEVETCVACGTTFIDHDPDCPQFDSERK